VARQTSWAAIHFLDGAITTVCGLKEPWAISRRLRRSSCRR